MAATPHYKRMQIYQHLEFPNKRLTLRNEPDPNAVIVVQMPTSSTASNYGCQCYRNVPVAFGDASRTLNKLH